MTISGTTADANAGRYVDRLTTCQDPAHTAGTKRTRIFMQSDPALAGETEVPGVLSDARVAVMGAGPANNQGWRLASTELVDLRPTPLATTAPRDLQRRSRHSKFRHKLATVCLSGCSAAVPVG